MDKLKKILVVIVAFTFCTIIINLFVSGNDTTDDPSIAETIEISEDNLIF